jgi:predicted MFS family arabinose efflux permease
MDAHRDRLLSPAFIALTLSELAYFTAAGLLIGVTPFFVTGPLGSDEAGLGLVAAAFGITTLLLRPFAGRAADRRGRRPLLIGGAALFALAMGAQAMSDDFVVALGLRLLLGVAEALYFVAGVAALVDLAPPGRTGEALSYNSLALYVGLAVGPMAGQLALGIGGFALAWLAGSALCVVAALLASFVPETASAAGSESSRGPTPLFHRAAVRPGVALMTGVAAMSAFLLLAGPHAERIGLDAWSLSFLAFGGVVVGCRIAFARLPDRVPPMRLAGAALALVATGLATTAVGQGVLGLLAGTVVLGTGVALMTPAIFAAVFGRVAPDERGVAAGTVTTFIDLGFAGGPFLAGSVAAAAGLPAAFAMAGLLALGGVAATLAGARLARPRPAAA